MICAGLRSLQKGERAAAGCASIILQILYEKCTQPQTDRGGGGKEGGTGCVCEVMVVVGRVATKVKGVCDYIGKSHLLFTKAGTHTHKRHTFQFLSIP